MSATKTEAQGNKPSLYAGLIAAALPAAALMLVFIRLPWSHAPHTPLPLQVQTPGENQVFESEQAGSVTTIRFLLDKVKRDPDDMIAENMLASQLLQKVRETGSAGYLQSAMTAAQLSLHSVPAIRNVGGLTALTRAEMASHDFAKARRHALEIVNLDPSTIGSYAVLADVLIEFGDYAHADAAVQQMRKLGMDTAETEIRIGRLLFLQGDTDGAKTRFIRAIAFVKAISPPPRESLAWCQWQLGEMDFSQGRYPSAEQHYRDALATYPFYVQALASLGRTLAARGNLSTAIEQYEQATRRFPDPTFIAALGDLYALANRPKDARIQYALVEQIGHLSTLNGARYNRQIAVFEADHNLNPANANSNAEREYSDRRDIYGADTLAWTALKAGKLAQAKNVIKQALRLSTGDARLFFHAGMIAKAGGDREAAREYLDRALTLNPEFDPLQSAVARKALAD